MPSEPAHRNSAERGAALLGLALIYLWIGVYCYPFFFHSLANNYREIESYTSDAPETLKLVEYALSAPLFQIGFFDYGHIYFNLAIALSYVYALFFPLDEWALFFILRLVSLLGVCLTVALVYRFAGRLLGPLYGLLAAGLLAFSPAAIGWGTEVHPDTWQMFFVTLALYFCARSAASERSRFGLVLAAAAAAGAAFGTKYLGVLLIPLLVVAVLMCPVGAATERRFAAVTPWIAMLAALIAAALAFAGYAAEPASIVGLFPRWALLDEPMLGRIAQVIRSACWLGAGACALGVVVYLGGFKPAAYRVWLIALSRLAAVAAIFFAVFAVTSPWAVYQLQFVPNVFWQSIQSNLGAWFGFRWLGFLFGFAGNNGDFVGPAVGVLSVVGGAILLLSLWRRDLRGARLPFLYVLGFALIFIAFLVVRVNRVTVVYGLPIVPPLVLLAVFGLSEIHALSTRWLGARRGALAAAMLAAAVMAAEAWHGAAGLAVYRERNLVVALAPDNQMLGDWLGRCVPVDAKILAAPYAYVPPRFERFQLGGTPDVLRWFAPDIVIVNSEIVQIFARDAETLKANPYAGFPQVIEFHDTIMHSGSWRAGPVFGRFQVYSPARPDVRIAAGCS